MWGAMMVFNRFGSCFVCGAVMVFNICGLCMDVDRCNW